MWNKKNVESNLILIFIELVNFKFNDAKKEQSKRETRDEELKLRSEFRQTEHHNRYLANVSRREDTLIDRQKNSLKSEKTDPKTAEKFLFKMENKKKMIWPAALYETLLVTSSVSKDQIKKHYHKMSLLTRPTAEI